MGKAKADHTYQIEQIVEGDEQAFKKIFLFYYESLCNFCWRYTKSGAVSEDLVQEAFADLWRLRQTLDPAKSIRVYLYQAVKHKALDYLDHQKVVRQHQKSHRRDHSGHVAPSRPKKEDKQFIRSARQAIDNLPTRAQQVYVLHREDGLTYREISAVMDISIKTVESQMSRALDMLRNELRDVFPDEVTERTIAKIFSIRSTGIE
ncbi:MAG: RNA polymerase sigma-70 factor [Balneolaceae bacterium]|nr:RNA polymerase sigma-70 factor [Balneolaceae bacterium]